jgi:hypothetical protein
LLQQDHEHQEEAHAHVNDFEKGRHHRGPRELSRRAY